MGCWHHIQLRPIKVCHCLWYAPVSSEDIHIVISKSLVNYTKAIAAQNTSTKLTVKKTVEGQRSQFPTASLTADIVLRQPWETREYDQHWDSLISLSWNSILVKLSISCLSRGERLDWISCECSHSWLVTWLIGIFFSSPWWRPLNKINWVSLIFHHFTHWNTIVWTLELLYLLLNQFLLSCR